MSVVVRSIFAVVLITLGLGYEGSTISIFGIKTLAFVSGCMTLFSNPAVFGIGIVMGTVALFLLRERAAKERNYK